MLPHPSVSPRILALLKLPLPGSRRPVTHFPAWPLLPAAVVLVFGTTLGAGILATGDAVRLADPTIGTTTCPGERLAWIFSSVHVGGYQPLARLGLWIQRTLWNGEPLMFHIVCLTLHGVASLLAYSLALRLGLRWQGALLAALLFVVHPTRAESVSWISMQGPLAATVFVLIALNVYAPLLHRSRARRGSRLLITGALIFLALLCDAWAASAPLLLLVLDIAWRRPWRPALLEKVPLVLVSLPFVVLAMESMESVPHAATLLQAPWLYVERVFWPVEYSACWWIPPSDSLFSLRPLLGLLLLGTVVATLCLSLRRPWRRAAWLLLGGPAACLFGTLLRGTPSGAAVADGDLYLALLGPCLIVGSLSCGVAPTHVARARLRPVATIVPLLALGWLAHVHATAFRDTEKLWQRSLEAQPDNPVARCALAESLSRGEPEERQVREALRLLDSRPQSALGDQILRVTRSRLYRALGDEEQADRELRAAMDLDRGHPPRLETTLEHAKWLARRGEVDDAHAALAAFPAKGWAPRQQILEGHAALCLIAGDPTCYLQWSEKLLERSPFDLILWYNRALLAKASGNEDEARRASRRLDELCPPNPGADGSVDLQGRQRCRAAPRALEDPARAALCSSAPAID
jgi:tetratricopeptide (TPR) repeat protein